VCIVASSNVTSRVRRIIIAREKRRQEKNGMRGKRFGKEQTPRILTLIINDDIVWL
jgi:hypothetical protein